MSGPPARVLVVDDDPDVLAFMELLLCAEGFAAACARSGDEALGRLGEGPVDLVLLDIAMPGCDGLDLCRRIKSGSGMRDLPVIVLSAYPGDLAASAAQAAGADHFLRKPFDNDELVALVRGELARPRRSG